LVRENLPTPDLRPSGLILRTWRAANLDRGGGVLQVQPHRGGGLHLIGELRAGGPPPLNFHHAAIAAGNLAGGALEAARVTRS
jgi:hypothetical protein